MKLEALVSANATTNRILLQPIAISSFVLKDKPCLLFPLHDGSSAKVSHKVDTEQSPRQSSDFIYASSDLGHLE